MTRWISTFTLLLVAPVLAIAQQGAQPPTIPAEGPGVQNPGKSTEEAAKSEAGRMLLEEGVPGLRFLLEEAGAPPLTFDQETQVQSVYEAHDANGGASTKASRRTTDPSPPP